MRSKKVPAVSDVALLWQPAGVWTVVSAGFRSKEIERTQEKGPDGTCCRLIHLCRHLQSLSEVVVKRELEQLRLWARNPLQSGVVPESSWQQHVTLIDALDAILHDMAVLNAATEAGQPASKHLRLVQNATVQALTEMSLEITEPARYQRKVQSRIRSLH
jgi:hypothetical protein